MATQKPTAKDLSELSEREAERLIFEAFRQAGKFLPQTPEEVEAAEAELGDELVALPPSLRDPLAILKRKPILRAVVRLPERLDSDAAESMACAAKNGSEIPPDVLAQMDLDEAEGDTERESENAKD